MPVRPGDPCTKGAPALVPRPKGANPPVRLSHKGRRGATHVIGGGKEPMTALLRAELSWRLDGARREASRTCA